MHGTIILYNLIYTKNTKYNCNMNTYICKWMPCMLNYQQVLLLGGEQVSMCGHLLVCMNVYVCFAGCMRGSEPEINMFCSAWSFSLEHFTKLYLGIWQLLLNKKKLIRSIVSQLKVIIWNWHIPKSVTYPQRTKLKTVLESALQC